MQKILIVDDMASVRASLAACLEGLPISISFAEDGAAALRLLKAEKFDLALLDLQMPVLDGPTLVRLLRGTPIQVEIVFVTAATSRAALADLFKLGVSEYIAKPFKKEEVREKVERALARRRAQAGQGTRSLVALSARPARDLLLATPDAEQRALFASLGVLHADDGSAAVRHARLFSFRGVVVDPLLPGLEWKALAPLVAGALVFAVGDAAGLPADAVLPRPLVDTGPVARALAADAAQLVVEDDIVKVGLGGGGVPRGYRRAADLLSETIGRLAEQGARGVIVDVSGAEAEPERLVTLVRQIQDWAAEQELRPILVGTAAGKAALAADAGTAAVPFFLDGDLAREALRYFEEE